MRVCLMFGELVKFTQILHWLASPSTIMQQEVNESFQLLIKVTLSLTNRPVDWSGDWRGRRPSKPTKTISPYQSPSSPFSSELGPNHDSDFKDSS